MNDTDYLPDEALAKIEANVPKMAQDFDLVINNAWAKSVQAHFKWRVPADVFARGESIYALVEGAMCVETLCKNLRAEREKNTFAIDFWQVAYALGPARVPYEETEQMPDHRVLIVNALDDLGPPLLSITDATPELDVIVVPRSFVESVLYSGAFEGEDLDRLHRQAEELLHG